MQHWFICAILAGVSFGLAAETSVPPVVRSVRVKYIQTSERLNPVAQDAISNALRSRRIALEERLDPAVLDRVDAAIRELYAEKGRTVRVAHSVSAVPPRGAEVTFDVIELCSCR